MTTEGEPAATASKAGLASWLAWYAAMGVSDLVAETPIDRFGRAEPDLSAPAPASPVKLGDRLLSPRTAEDPTLAGSPDGPPSWVLDDAGALSSPADPSPRSAPLQTGGLPLGGPIVDARALAGSCQSLEAIEAALKDFDGCALKETAINLCFADGNPQAPIMLIGEAPGAQEDRQGKPFVGPSGQLLDRMLATIGLDRSKVYITNCIYWRPPGNRTPTAAEIAVCQPFLERQIELLRPKLVVFVGGIAARALLGATQGVTKLRGRMMTYKTTDDLEIPALVMFHPAYLLRQPAQKRFSWRDLLTTQRIIKEM